MIKLNFNVSIIKKILLLFIIIGYYSCKSNFIKNIEAREEAKEFNNAKLAQQKINNTIYANDETQPVISASIHDDSADDPAIWIHPTDKNNSIVFGSNKKRGIHSYDLNGKEKQFIDYARINNIDVRQQVSINDDKMDILGGSNRTNKSIDLFIINKNGNINNKPDFSISLGNFKPYGFCLFKDINDSLFCFVNNKKGKVLQIEINITNNQLDAKNVRTIQLSSQVEGMTVDDSSETLYIGEEQVGIHIYSANKNANTNSEMIKNSGKNNPNLRFDIEGIDLLAPHYLVASSQGNFSYAIFDLLKKDYLTSFKIEKNIVDGVEETDGLCIYNQSIGDKYRNGILIVQDGFNYDKDSITFQNFKYISLEKVIQITKN